MRATQGTALLARWTMSAEPLSSSVWDDPQNDPTRPKTCPHCDATLAHPDDIRDNEEIEARGLWSAYRRHREAHFAWGDDPSEDGSGDKDPYLGSYYSGDKDALWEPDEDDDVGGDPDEIVGHVYQVDIRHEATVRATVVAPDERRAAEKVEEMRLHDEADIHGNVPTAEITMELHDDAMELGEVTRDDKRAERMEGWPW